MKKKTTKKASSLATLKTKVARDIGDALGEMIVDYLAEHDEDLSADLVMSMGSLDNTEVMRCLGSGGPSVNLISEATKEASGYIELALRPIIRAALVDYVKSDQALPEYCNCTGCKKVCHKSRAPKKKQARKSRKSRKS